MLDFTKGYRKYELITAMNFNSVYAMRMYELMSGQKKPLYFSFDDLRLMFEVENKYKLSANFKARVLDVAKKKELDENSPYSFNYKRRERGSQSYWGYFIPNLPPRQKRPDFIADRNAVETFRK